MYGSAFGVFILIHKKIVKSYGYNHKNYKIRYAKVGDFLIDDRYTIEVDGKNKDFKQIANISNSFYEI